LFQDRDLIFCKGKSIEFYRVNDVEKINKKLRNRKKKEEEKRKQTGSADDEGKIQLQKN
jgi:hypothetical protein